jgi:hypothetical protein
MQPTISETNKVSIVHVAMAIANKNSSKTTEPEKFLPNINQLLQEFRL